MSPRSASSTRDRWPRFTGSRGMRQVASLVVIALLALVLARRIRALEEEIERASVVQLVHALRLAVDAAAEISAARGDEEALRHLEHGNPMRLLEPSPANYAGEISREDRTPPRPGQWWFDAERAELLYWPKNPRLRVQDSPRSGRARFKILGPSDEECHGASHHGPSKHRALRLVAIATPEWLDESGVQKHRAGECEERDS